MKAVILAAGLGRRMQSEEPKPLLPLFGMPIIEHTIRKLKGIDIIVVYHDERIKKYIEKKFPDVKLIYNPEPDRENGWSLYLAKDFVNEDFLLLMADHYYGEEFFQFKKRRNTTVFVSKHCRDAEEATKVKVDGKKVVNIGKKLRKYDYFDTGFFYCKKDVFKYAEKLAEKGKMKLAEIMKELAKEGKLEYEVVNASWTDIDTKKELKYAEELVKKSLIKEGDGIISKNVNRKISMRITKYLLKFDFLTPNVLTIVSFLIGIFSSALFMLKSFIFAGLMAQFCSILDGCDGEIARLKNLKSKFGGILDAYLDRIADFLIIFGIFLAYGIDTISSIAFLIALLGCIMPSYIYHLSGIRSDLFGRDVRLFIVFIGGILATLNKEFLLYTLLFIGIYMNVGAISFLLQARKKG